LQHTDQVIAPANGAAREQPRTAVLIPCFNEASTVSQVITDFRAAISDAVIYVYDNNSTDRTAQVAQKSGAIVRRELRRGKGNVVRRMFRDIDADIYVLVDGDSTYDAASARRLIGELINGSFDMVVGARVSQQPGSDRFGHRFGNRILTHFVATAFGRELLDLLSGYRVLSRRFVKSFPQLSSGFEIETELTIHALTLELPIAEFDTQYYARPVGSDSKLNTWRDGARILFAILQFYRWECPLAFFTIIGCCLAALSVALAIPIFITYITSGLVPRIPTAILSTGLMILAFLAIAVGFVLDTVTRGRRETKLLAYLAQPPFGN
jgi:glycosyltransferase involved in cell wall biosynthesis